MTDLLDGLLVPGPDAPSWRVDRRALPSAPTTRFAPAPTGDLHLGHLVNAIYVWGAARASGGRVILRIEDHDRQRSRPAFERGILADLERLGLLPDEPPLEAFAGATPYRQSDIPERYETALGPLREAGRVYACACSRSTVAAWAEERGRPFTGPGCPGGCRERALPAEGNGLRCALGAGTESWVDLLCGPVGGDPAAEGDLLVRDRVGNWTYAFCVVVDDLAGGITLVVRGRDLLDATPAQLRLGRLLGRERPPAFLHHPLVRRSSGEKLSKAAGDTAVRSLLDEGRRPAEVLGVAARLAGLIPEPRPVSPAELGALVLAAA